MYKLPNPLSAQIMIVQEAESEEEDDLLYYNFELILVTN